MKKTEIPIVPREDCQSALRKTRLRDKFLLYCLNTYHTLHGLSLYIYLYDTDLHTYRHESFICAGGIPGKDTCVV